MDAVNNPLVLDPRPRSWRDEGLRYFIYSWYLKQTFGGRVHKVSIDGGFTCPNVDGAVAVGGCVFCDNRSFSPSRRLPRNSVTAQLDAGIHHISNRFKVNRFLAYFQPGTNTYAPIPKLRSLFFEAIAHPQVVGLAVGTRPDCVPDEVIELLQELAGGTWLSVELGMQSSHDRSLDWMNRGHHHQAFVDAVERCRGRGFEIAAHVILGLPGESHNDMRDTARELARLKIDAVKLHNLYAVHNTPLVDWVGRGEVKLLDRDEYVQIVADFLELLPPTCRIERIGGDAPPDFLLGPTWCLDRAGLRAALESELVRRNTWQGRLFGAPHRS